MRAKRGMTIGDMGYKTYWYEERDDNGRQERRDIDG